MNPEKKLVAFFTIVRKETYRFLRIWIQTLLPSVVTAALYFLIFGTFIGSQIRPIEGFTYMQFIVPGLVMMGVIINSYSNVSSSFFGNKFQRSIEELLVSPTPNWIIIAGYTVGGVLRGMLVGFLVLLVSLFFTHLTISNFAIVITFMLLTAVLFSLAGLFNAIFAQNFDDISLIPTFVLTPLIYLGGVFYSIRVLPPFWQGVSQVNPIFYMINGFRYGFLGFADSSILGGFFILIFFIVVLAGVNWRLLEKGTRMKN